MENTPPNTNNFLNWVEIKNFKSIKDLRLDCKRVNVFIGKPNVGKSNILEGLGLLGAEYSVNKKFLGGIARYQSLSQLFYNNSVVEPIQIYSNKDSCFFKKDDSFSSESDDFLYYKGSYNSSVDFLNNNGQNKTKFLAKILAAFVVSENFLIVDRKGKSKSISGHATVKKYVFGNIMKFTISSQRFLLPPYGSNLFSIIDSIDQLKSEFGELFLKQGLEFVLSRESLSFSLQRRESNYIYSFPFFSIADTFRRFMFYVTAIESNKNSVIIFEEPEVHSFPPYTQDIAYRMIYSEENQFFVSTHSPYLLHTLVENLKDDQLNVFVTYYEDYETKVKALTPEELGFVQEYSTDVFFNLDRFVPNAQSANPA